MSEEAALPEIPPFDTPEQLFESNEESEVPEVQPPTKPTEEELDDKAFESGMNESMGQEPVKEEVISAPVLFAGLTEDEFKKVIAKANRVDELTERLKKTHDQAFGKIGQLEQVIRGFQQPVNQPSPISASSFAALTEYFGDADLAAALAKDLSNVTLASAAQQPTIDFDAMNQGLDDRFDGLSKDFEVKLLNIAHPDWQDLKASPEFETWKQTLKPEAVETLTASWDGSILAQAFTSFKTWKNKKASVAEDKQQRLNAAVPIKGNAAGNNTSVDDDAFNAGWKSVVEGRK